MAQTTPNQFDILVAGAGPVGQIAAIALARGGYRVALVGPVAPPDRRTTALMQPSLDYLRAIGIAPFSPEKTAELKTMQIIDATQRLVRARPVTFRSAEIGLESFGLNIPNAHLAEILADAVARQAGITRYETAVAAWNMGENANEAMLGTGEALSARLVIAADGRRSPAREAAGIKVAYHTYPQSAVVLNFGHARPHGSVSTEFHTRSGPFTQVPLPGHRSSLVWVVSPAEAERLAAIDDEAISLEIERNMQSLLGKVEAEPGRQVFPLSVSMPAKIAARRTVLISEAAHVIPPIGAQGMNLGIRDVQEIARILAPGQDDPGDNAILSAYRNARRVDILARSGAADVLNRSLLSDLLPAQIARTAGLGLMAGIAPLRRFVMREGMLPGSGWTDIGSTVREKIGRKHA